MSADPSSHAVRRTIVIVVTGLLLLVIGVGAAGAAAPRRDSSTAVSSDRSTSEGSAGGSPTGAVPPHVNVFARALHGSTLRPATTPVVVSEGKDLDGCDVAYGLAQGVCVPVAFPPGVTDKCQWLEDHDFGPIEITGPDPQHLAPAGGRVSSRGHPYACPAQLGAP